MAEGEVGRTCIRVCFNQHTNQKAKQGKGEGERSATRRDEKVGRLGMDCEEEGEEGEGGEGGRERTLMESIGNMTACSEIPAWKRRAKGRERERLVR